jgi:hypothetical protein
MIFDWVDYLEQARDLLGQAPRSFYFSCIPLQVVGISSTSRGLAPCGWGDQSLLVDLVPLPY